MIKPIVHWPDQRLTQKSEEVKSFDDNLKILFQDMHETLVDAKGVGISAIQIGVPLRACIMTWLSKMTHKQEFIYMCNPEIVDKYGDIYLKTGCLSVPGIFVPVHAPADVTIKYQDLDGNEKLHFFSDETCPTPGCCGGIMARCSAHELDHMNGKIILDHLSGSERSDAIKKYKKLNKGK